MSSILITFFNEEGIESLVFDAEGTSSVSVDFKAIKGNLVFDSIGTSEVVASFKELKPFGEVSLIGTSDLSFTVSIDNVFKTNFVGTSEAEIYLEYFGNSEENQLRFILDILPAEITKRYREYKVRCFLNNVVLPIKGFSFTKSSVSSTFSAQLADLSKRGLINPSGVFRLEIGEMISGAMIWKTIFDSGKLSTKSYSIGWSDDSPTDTFNFTLLSDLSEKLNKVSPQTLVIYDGGRVKIEEGDTETFYDTAGRAYAPELINIGGLSIYNLFQKIFIEKCGFASYQTNIPNSRIRRADFNLGSTYYESIKGYLGMFDLAIFEIAGVLWILDKSNVLPSGFPAPKDLQIQKYKNLSYTENQTYIEALWLSYVANETEQLTRIQRFEQDPVQTIGGTSLSITVEVNRAIYDYYSKGSLRPVKSLLDYEIRKTYEGVRQVGEYKEDYTYNSAGRATKVVKTTKQYIPTADLVGNTISVNYSLQDTEQEDTTITYSAHPFVPYTIYQKEVKTIKRGLIAIDELNTYLGEPYKQFFVKAHEAGVLTEEMAVEFGDLQTTVETFKPLRSGQVKSEVHTINHIRKGLPNAPVSSPKVGDVTLNPNGNEKQARLLVLAADDIVLTGKGIEDYHIGEMPLYLGIPAARRRLKRLQNFSGSRSVDLLALDLELEDGSIRTLRGRANENLGAFLIETVSINGNDLGTSEQTVEMNIQGEPI